MERIMKKILILLMLSVSATAGLPPTTSKLQGESTKTTTFNYEFPNFTGTHNGTTTTLGTLGIPGGGTGKTTALDSTDIVLPRSSGVTPQRTLSDQIDHIWSASITGEGILTNNGNGTVNLTQANAVIRTSKAISLLTQTGGVATVTVADTSSITNGSRVTIRGATQTSYNGTFSVNVISLTQFTYAVPNNPASPATGTIVALEPDAPLNYAPIPAASNIALTDHATNYIFADWNYGVPVYGVTTDSKTVVGLARIVVYVVSREGNKLWVVDNREYNVDSINK